MILSIVIIKKERANKYGNEILSSAGRADRRATYGILFLVRISAVNFTYSSYALYRKGVSRIVYINSPKS